MRLLHVPYKSPSEAIQNVAGGVVDASFVELAAALPLVNAGQLRALAQTGTSRSTSMPNVPTVAEAGLSGFSLYVWGGYAVSAKTPDAIARKLEAALLKTYASPDYLEYVANQGSELRPLGEKDMKEMIAKELQENKDAIAYITKR